MRLRIAHRDSKSEYRDTFAHSLRKRFAFAARLSDGGGGATRRVRNRLARLASLSGGRCACANPRSVTTIVRSPLRLATFGFTK